MYQILTAVVNCVVRKCMTFDSFSKLWVFSKYLAKTFYDSQCYNEKKVIKLS